MRVAVAIMLVLLLVAIAMIYWHMRTPAAQTVVYNTVEADKRKKLGLNLWGSGVDFAW